jgi:hypothetical protein
MKAHAVRVKFESAISPDQQELIKLHGWEVAFALGVPLTFEDWRVLPDRDAVRPDDAAHWKKAEPYKPEDGASFEERVWGGLDHMMYHTGRNMSDKVQVECSLASWHETSYHGYMAGMIVPRQPRSVKFGSRTGWLQGETLMGIPIVVVPDGGKPVLRPRWPETIRLVQGG